MDVAVRAVLILMITPQCIVCYRSVMVLISNVSYHSITTDFAITQSSPFLLVQDRDITSIPLTESNLRHQEF